jgi:RND family efflux transporter MFP subunit
MHKGEIIAILKDSQVKLRLEELNGAVKSSEAKLAFLESEDFRLNDLIKKNLVSNSELELNKSNFISASSDLVQAKARLKQFLDTVEKLEVKAPYEGVVMQHLSQPGQLLNAGDNIIEFMQANNLEAIVNVPFKYKSQIKANAVWQIESSDKQVFDATIERYVPAATGQSHTIEVYLSLVNADLWSGEAINVLVPTQARKKVIAVPRDALVIRKNGTYVYTIVENKSHKVDVITGMAQGELIEVKGLLSADDLVIIRGNERLANKQDVSVLN